MLQKKRLAAVRSWSIAQRLDGHNCHNPQHHCRQPPPATTAMEMDALSYFDCGALFASEVDDAAAAARPPPRRWLRPAPAPRRADVHLRELAAALDALRRSHRSRGPAYNRADLRASRRSPLADRLAEDDGDEKKPGTPGTPATLRSLDASADEGEEEEGDGTLSLPPEVVRMRSDLLFGKESLPRRPPGRRRRRRRSLTC